jgi:hypothetical protein
MSADVTNGPTEPRRPSEPTEPDVPTAAEETTEAPAAEGPPTATEEAPAAAAHPDSEVQPEAAPAPETVRAPEAAAATPPEAGTPATAAVPEPVEPPSSDDDVVAPTATRTDPVADDETHVAAISPQSGDDPFTEVDGGEGSSEPTTTIPTADEDAALREERARRFGRPTASEEQPNEGQPTVAVPLAAAGAGAVATVGSSETSSTRTMPVSEEPTTTSSGEEDPFKDFDDGPASRAAAHWWSILISVVFTPVAWYLIADGGERTSFNLTNGGPLNLAGPLELAAGALCLFIVLLAARWSSVGAIVVGSVALLAGAAFIVFNEEAMELVAQYQGTLVQALNQLGQNIVDHLLVDAESGRIAIYGLVLIMAGVISHGARRQGRREERRRAAIGA